MGKRIYDVKWIENNSYTRTVSGLSTGWRSSIHRKISEGGKFYLEVIRTAGDTQGWLGFVTQSGSLAWQNPFPSSIRIWGFTNFNSGWSHLRIGLDFENRILYRGYNNEAFTMHNFPQSFINYDRVFVGAGRWASAGSTTLMINAGHTGFTYVPPDSSFIPFDREYIPRLNLIKSNNQILTFDKNEWINVDLLEPLNKINFEQFGVIDIYKFITLTNKSIFKMGSSSYPLKNIQRRIIKGEGFIKNISNINHV